MHWIFAPFKMRQFAPFWQILKSGGQRTTDIIVVVVNVVVVVVNVVVVVVNVVVIVIGVGVVVVNIEISHTTPYSKKHENIFKI